MVWSLFGREYAGRRNAVTCPGCGRHRRHIHGHRRHVGRRRPAREQGLDHARRSEPRRGRGLRRAARRNSASTRPEREEVLHGTTVGSNTILQRSGARTGLITTRGFRDVLEIGRIRMPDMFDLTWDKPKPLVPRRHRLEVAERIAADGAIVEPLDEASVDRGRRALVAAGIEAVAICLINSYRNPAHEQRVEAILRAALPRSAGDGFLRRAARAQGIRAHQHDGGERLSAGRHAQLPAQPRKRPALHRRRRADPGHHLQRRHAGGRDRLREAGVRGGLRARPAA